jgi:hypothetical protein
VTIESFWPGLRLRGPWSGLFVSSSGAAVLLDGPNHVVDVERFLQHTTNAGPCEGATEVWLRGHDDDRELVVVIAPSNLLNERRPIHDRHHQVDEEKAWAAHLVETLERLPTVARYSSLVAGILEHALDALGNIPVVFNYENHRHTTILLVNRNPPKLLTFFP